MQKQPDKPVKVRKPGVMGIIAMIIFCWLAFDVAVNQYSITRNQLEILLAFVVLAIPMQIRKLIKRHQNRD